MHRWQQRRDLKELSLLLPIFFPLSPTQLLAEGGKREKEEETSGTAGNFGHTKAAPSQWLTAGIQVYGLGSSDGRLKDATTRI